MAAAPFAVAVDAAGRTVAAGSIGPSTRPEHRVRFDPAPRDLGLPAP